MTLAKQFLKKTGNIINRTKVNCGNKSISTNLFLDSNVANHLKCVICKKVLTKPRKLSLCQHIYCEECITNWKQEATSCCATDDECNKCQRNIHKASIIGFSGESKKIWQDLQYECDKCEMKN